MTTRYDLEAKIDQLAKRIRKVEIPLQWGYLRDLMSNLSEEHYCAGWLSGLEYSIWYLLFDAPDNAKFGMSTPDPVDLHKIAVAAHNLGGWVIWDEHSDQERFIPLSEWIPKYEARIASGKTY